MGNRERRVGQGEQVRTDAASTGAAPSACESAATKSYLRIVSYRIVSLTSRAMQQPIHGGRWYIHFERQFHFELAVFCALFPPQSAFGAMIQSPAPNLLDRRRRLRICCWLRSKQ